MKKIVILAVFTIAAVVLLTFLFFNLPNNQHKATKPVASERSNQAIKEIISSTSLFVPYWTLGENFIPIKPFYSELLYFGLAVNKNGVNKEDDGYKKIKNFNYANKNLIPSLLMVRMIDSKTNYEILEDREAQTNIIKDSILIAKENDFYGIVLDFEVSGLPFESSVSSINIFISDFSKAAKQNNLSFGITLFGDTFARVRPYDVRYLGSISDKVYIMTYDFHKAKNSPGPNFPFSAKETYGYDFKTMVSDFVHVVPKQKLVFVFGMFGYDWKLDENGESIDMAQPLSLNQITQVFLNKCKFTNCKAQQDLLSKEAKVIYTDPNGYKHEVWFEDRESAKIKEDHLKKQGIESIGFWAYSYF